jgi:acyl transferase domain-containing protein
MLKKAGDPAMKRAPDARADKQAEDFFLGLSRMGARDTEDASCKHAVAIVGRAGFFPGAEDVDAFTANLVAQTGMLGMVPPERGIGAAAEGRRGAFLDDIAGFDHGLFGITPHEAPYIDPRLRLLLMSTWHAFEDACIAPASLAGGRTAVLVAAEESSYGEYVAAAEVEPYTPLAASSWTLPNRISHAFGFQGKSLLVNAACAGASVALHMAIRLLRAGEADCVVVGTANLLYGQGARLIYQGQEALGLLSGDDDNACRPFQAGASGTLPAEAVVTVILKRHDDAVRDGDRIHGLLLGSHVNHVGAGAGFCAPDAASQAAAMVAAYTDAGVDAGSVGYLEAHGACTRLGDTQEIAAMLLADQQLADRGHAISTGDCLVSSVKPLLGHANCASGLVSLLRVLATFRCGRRFGIRDFDQPDPLIRLAGSRFRFSSDHLDWPTTPGGAIRPRRAAINNFGAGGVNAHVIVGEARAAAPAAADTAPEVCFAALSAATAGQLVKLAQRLLGTLSSSTHGRDLEASLVAGGHDLAFRVVFRFDSIDALAGKLRKYIESEGQKGYLYRFEGVGRTAIAGYFHAYPRLKSAVLENPASDKRLLFQLWADGYVEPLRQFVARLVFRRLPVPWYPFACERAWLARTATAPLRAASAVVDARSTTPLPLADARAAVRAVASELLNVDVAALAFDVNLAELGFDSISLLAFARHLSRRFDIAFGPTLFFTHATLGALAEHAVSQGAAAAVEETTLPPSRLANGNAVIAITGMSGRFARAQDPADLWRMLVEGADATCQLAARKALRPVAHSNVLRAGLIEDISGFDAAFFDISPREAELMDPRHRLLLEETWKALEDSCFAQWHAPHARVGVFIGAEPGHYQSVTGALESVTDNSNSVLAARISYGLDLSGPNLVIDTACSSGLVAFHQACMSLAAGECDGAVAGAVNLMITPEPFQGMQHAGMLSPDGRCRAFDQAANGIVPGEAVVAIVLRRLDDALADGDPIYAIVRGTGINHDGRTNGITAPSGAAQAALVKDVHRRYGIAPSEIGHIVAHGTGTPLGDPIEIEALGNAFAPNDGERRFCAMTSVKPTFGHTFAASGLVSLVALVQTLEHKAIYASLGCERESSHIDWARTPFYVNKALVDWPDAGRPRMGAVSAFGVSGTNAHVVLQSVDHPHAVAGEPTPVLLALSARRTDALESRISDLLGFLEGYEHGDMRAVSRTLLTSRKHFRHRVAFVVSDRAAAIAMLRAWLHGAREGAAAEHVVPRDFLADPVQMAKALEWLSEAAQAGDTAMATLDGLAALYCEGYALAWERLGAGIAKLRLPNYPFKHKPYWTSRTPDAKHASVHLHPLLHENTSDLYEQRYVARFSGEESFFTDHVIGGRRLLPGVAYLEMAREAASRALGLDATEVLLGEVVWLRPIVAEGALTVRIALSARADGGADFRVLGETADESTVVHAQGVARRGVPRGTQAEVNVAALRAACTQQGDVAAYYARYAELGMAYGAAHRGMRQLWLGDRQLLVEVELPESIRADAANYVLHPSLLDAVLQASIGLDEAAVSKVLVPFALGELRIEGVPGTRAWAWIRYAKNDQPGAAVRKLDVDVCADDGRVLLAMRNFSARALDGETSTPTVPVSNVISSTRQPQPLLLMKRSLRQMFDGVPGNVKCDTRVVLLCGATTAVEKSVRDALGAARCIAIDTQGNLAERFTSYAAMLFAELREVMSSRSRGGVLIQVVVSAREPALRGLAGLLKTAAIENPRVTGQLIEVADPCAPMEIISHLQTDADSLGQGEVLHA